MERRRAGWSDVFCSRDPEGPVKEDREGNTPPYKPDNPTLPRESEVAGKSVPLPPQTRIYSLQPSQPGGTPDAYS
jgi:hypothetical protein